MWKASVRHGAQCRIFEGHLILIGRLFKKRWQKKRLQNKIAYPPFKKTKKRQKRDEKKRKRYACEVTNCGKNTRVKSAPESERGGHQFSRADHCFCFLFCPDHREQRQIVKAEL